MWHNTRHMATAYHISCTEWHYVASALPTEIVSWLRSPLSPTPGNHALPDTAAPPYRVGMKCLDRRLSTGIVSCLTSMELCFSEWFHVFNPSWSSLQCHTIGCVLLISLWR